MNVKVPYSNTSWEHLHANWWKTCHSYLHDCQAPKKNKIIQIKPLWEKLFQGVLGRDSALRVHLLLSGHQFQWASSLEKQIMSSSVLLYCVFLPLFLLTAVAMRFMFPGFLSKCPDIFPTNPFSSASDLRNAFPQIRLTLWDDLTEDLLSRNFFICQ